MFATPQDGAADGEFSGFFSAGGLEIWADGYRPQISSGSMDMVSPMTDKILCDPKRHRR